MRMVQISTVIVWALLMLQLGGCGSTPDADPEQLHISCLAKPDPGPCRARKKAFYYDYETDTCQQFIYGGCKGKVPFETLGACKSTCRGSGMP